MERVYLFLFSICFAIVQSQVVVNTTRGQIAGFRADYGNDKSKLWFGQADVFLGIPYVQAPIGNLRFAKPQPLTSFPGSSPLQANQFASACPQYNYNLRGLNMSEDCLYLNIFTPNAYSTYKYPVMVFIHGGAFLTGHAGDFPVSGIVRNLVSRGVVIVTLQYRLGLLGFFTTRTQEFPANLGPLDQIEALKWIIEEIPHFGGNPYLITLFGQSAGSASVSAHLLSPISQNLFQQAIMESGSILTCFDGATGFKNMSETRAEQLCNFTDWSTQNFTALKSCMMNLDYNTWLPLESNNLFGWEIVQDDYFMPEVPRDLSKNRPNIPVIYGNNHDEWSLADLQLLATGSMTLDKYTSVQFMIDVLGFTAFLYESGRQNDVYSILSAVYANPAPSNDDHIGWLKSINNAMTAITGTAFTGREIDWFVYQNNSNVYTYEFNWPTQVGRPYSLPGWDPVFHLSELYMIFMPEFYWEPVFNNDVKIQQELQVADFMGKTWTNFAKFGQPTLDNSWQPTTSLTNQDYFNINITTQMDSGFRRIDRMIWNQAIPALIGDWPPNNPVSL